MEREFEVHMTIKTVETLTLSAEDHGGREPNAQDAVRLAKELLGYALDDSELSYDIVLASAKPINNE